MAAVVVLLFVKLEWKGNRVGVGRERWSNRNMMPGVGGERVCCSREGTREKEEKRSAERCAA